MHAPGASQRPERGRVVRVSDVDDGSGKPEGYETPDGCLVVRSGEYCETPYGQYQRWMSQAPDLVEKYESALMEIARLNSAQY